MPEVLNEVAPEVLNEVASEVLNEVVYEPMQEPPVHVEAPEIIIKEVLNKIVEKVITTPSKVEKTVSNQKKTIYFIDKISKMNMKLF